MSGPSNNMRPAREGLTLREMLDEIRRQSGTKKVFFEDHRETKLLRKSVMDKAQAAAAAAAATATAAASSGQDDQEEEEIPMPVLVPQVKISRTRSSGDKEGGPPAKRRKTVSPKRIPPLPPSPPPPKKTEEEILDGGKGLRPIAFMKYFVEKISPNEEIMRHIIRITEARDNFLEICPPEMRNALDIGLDELINVDEIDALCLKNRFNKEACVELLKLPDQAFKKLLMKHGRFLTLEMAGTLIDVAHDGNLAGRIRTTKNFKYLMIIKYALLPYILDPKVTLRAVLAPFAKMAAIGTDFIIAGVVKPIIKNGHIKLPHNLLNMLDGNMCLERILDWAQKKKYILEGNFAQILMDIISGPKFTICPLHNEKLLNLIQSSFQETPEDIKNAKFAMFIFERYKTMVSDDCIKRCLAVNEHQKTVLKARITNILEDEVRTRQFKSFTKIRI